MNFFTKWQKYLLHFQYRYNNNYVWFKVSAGVDEICYLLGYNTAQSGGFLLMIQDNLLGDGTNRLSWKVSKKPLFYAT